ncbi:D-2-hydroxyglutaric acid dehydrogenase [Oratosquilla oratoria]|uniref:D-2-hydroxyglutaric acid dehydrogenase n=1 Tax=Oratosquilla oratoria TaxID=337810 RepID=UPI003F7747F2
MLKQMAQLLSRAPRNRLIAVTNGFQSQRKFQLDTSAWHHAKVELTSKRYPIRRGDFSQINPRDIEYFRGLLDSHRVITEENELEGYNTDWLRTVRGVSSVVLKPRTTEEVVTIMKHCSERKLAVCPQGGNTGLVGGSVPVFDEVVVSTALMNKIESLDELSGVMVCQSGCVLETLDNYLSENGLMMPLDLGAKGSCHIGGNVSTNAGGLRLLRYGSLHGSVLGLEAVLASGEVVDCLSSLKKDNTGYDLKHLFIGSEGTLGIVTKVAIQCPTKPRSVTLAFLGLESFDDVLNTFKECKAKLGEILSSCEFIDASSMECVTQNLNLKSPIEPYPFYMLIEAAGSNGDHDEEKLNNFLEETMGSGMVSDGTVSSEPSRMMTLWALRERIAEALLHDGYTYKYDISIPLLDFYKVVEDMRERLGDSVVRCCGYGHVGDGNLHLNITTREYDQEIFHRIEPFVYERTSQVKGSISAEHGLGFKKRNYIGYSKSDNAVHLMKQLKKMMDPQGILNPYKVLPE